MSRTPKADRTKLPIWAQEQIADLEDKLALALEERDEAYGWCDNFESLLEGLTKGLEERSVEIHETNDDPLPPGYVPNPEWLQRPVQDAGTGVRGIASLWDSPVRGGASWELQPFSD